MYIECLIKRADDSPTFVDFEQVRYKFTKNAAGHFVCFVGGEAHQKRLLAMGSETYRPYTNPAGLEADAQGNAPQPMTRQILKERRKETEFNPDGSVKAEAPVTADQTAPPATVMVDFDWTLDQKVAKAKEFKFLSAKDFKGYIDANRDQVMTWPIDVRREVAKKLDKMMPEEDPGIEGFVIDDYIRKGSPGDT